MHTGLLQNYVEPSCARGCSAWFAEGGGAGLVGEQLQVVLSNKFETPNILVQEDSALWILSQEVCVYKQGEGRKEGQ